jgi:hypothetical protein
MRKRVTGTELPGKQHRTPSRSRKIQQLRRIQTCIYLYISGSFNDSVSEPDYIPSNDRVTEMNWKHAEGIGRGLIYGTIATSVWKDWEKPRKVSVRSITSYTNLSGRMISSSSHSIRHFVNFIDMKIIIYYYYYCHSSVGIVARLRARRRWILGSIPGGGKRFVSSPKLSDRLWDPPSL